MKVYSLVVGLPFSPLDFDLGRLARGEWNASVDRFRLWYLPSESDAESPQCYLMVRKLDPRDGVLLYCHAVVNLSGDGSSNFDLGIMSNDEVRANAMLRSVLGVPPSYHRRKHVRVIEDRWRGDKATVMRFLANVHSALASGNPDLRGKDRPLEIRPSPEMMGELKRGMAAWWGRPGDGVGYP